MLFCFDLLFDEMDNNNNNNSYFRPAAYSNRYSNDGPIGGSGNNIRRRSRDRGSGRASGNQQNLMLNNNNSNNGMNAYPSLMSGRPSLSPQQQQQQTASIGSSLFRTSASPSPSPPFMYGDSSPSNNNTVGAGAGANSTAAVMGLSVNNPFSSSVSLSSGNPLFQSGGMGMGRDYPLGYRPPSMPLGLQQPSVLSSFAPPSQNLAESIIRQSLSMQSQPFASSTNNYQQSSSAAAVMAGARQMNPMQPMQRQGSGGGWGMSSQQQQQSQYYPDNPINEGWKRQSSASSTMSASSSSSSFYGNHRDHHHRDHRKRRSRSRSPHHHKRSSSYSSNPSSTTSTMTPAGNNQLSRQQSFSSTGSQPYNNPSSSPPLSSPQQTQLSQHRSPRASRLDDLRGVVELPAKSTSDQPIAPIGSPNLSLKLSTSAPSAIPSSASLNLTPSQSQQQKPITSPDNDKKKPAIDNETNIPLEQEKESSNIISNQPAVPTKSPPLQLPHQPSPPPIGSTKPQPPLSSQVQRPLPPQDQQKVLSTTKEILDEGDVKPKQDVQHLSRYSGGEASPIRAPLKFDASGRPSMMAGLSLTGTVSSVAHPSTANEAHSLAHKPVSSLNIPAAVNSIATASMLPSSSLPINMEKKLVDKPKPPPPPAAAVMATIMPKITTKEKQSSTSSSSSSPIMIVSSTSSPNLDNESKKEKKKKKKKDKKREEEADDKNSVDDENDQNPVATSKPTVKEPKGAQPLTAMPSASLSEDSITRSASSTSTGEKVARVDDNEINNNDEKKKQKRSRNAPSVPTMSPQESTDGQSIYQPELFDEEKVDAAMTQKKKAKKELKKFQLQQQELAMRTLSISSAFGDSLSAIKPADIQQKQPTLDAEQPTPRGSPILTPAMTPSLLPSTESLTLKNDLLQAKLFDFLKRKSDVAHVGIAHPKLKYKAAKNSLSRDADDSLPNEQEFIDMIYAENRRKANLSHQTSLPSNPRKSLARIQDTVEWKQREKTFAENDDKVREVIKRELIMFDNYVKQVAACGKQLRFEYRMDQSQINNGEPTNVSENAVPSYGRSRHSSRYPSRLGGIAEFLPPDCEQKFAALQEKKDQERSKNLAVVPDMLMFDDEKKRKEAIMSLGIVRTPFTLDNREPICAEQQSGNTSQHHKHFGEPCLGFARALSVSSSASSSNDNNELTCYPTPTGCNCVRSVLMEYERLRPWSDIEKCIFLDKFLQFPKDFRKIAIFLRNKTTTDVISFYYATKKICNYKELLKDQYIRRKAHQPTNTLDILTRGAKWLGVDFPIEEISRIAKNRLDVYQQDILSADPMNLTQFIDDDSFTSSYPVERQMCTVNPDPDVRVYPGARALRRKAYQLYQTSQPTPGSQ